MINIEELKQKIEELGYLATEKLVYDTFKSLYMFANAKTNSGQDIYAICLEGPPGAGKTEFAKMYTKLSSKLLNRTVEMVSYQCDATTGKTELFEDINISAAIRGDADNVNIPGKLVEAIKKVNEGKKVVLFIDEYDKAREETDAFLLQFLQSGNINSTQHGDLEIKEEYKSNLQVILCKNDMREELSGPLSRRIRIIRLDYMTPETFYKVANRTLIEDRIDKVDDRLINLVSLIYQHTYDSKEVYNRLPSCSEMLTAIEDADILLKKANAPQYIIYDTIINNMFKSLDDINTFESSLNTVKNQNDGTLSAVVQSMKIQRPLEESEDLNSLIAEKVFVNEAARLKEKADEMQKKTEEMQKLITDYQVKFENMEKQRKQAIEEEIRKILLENGKLVSTTKIPNIVNNFEDETAYVKRGANIFELPNNDWTDVGELNFPNLSHHELIDKLVEHASNLGIIIYENGTLLKGSGEQNLILFSDLDENNKIRYRFMSSQPILPSTYVSDIANFIDFAYDVYTNQHKTGGQIADHATDLIGNFKLNTLVYNDEKMDFEEVQPSVYHLDLSGQLDDENADLNSIKELASTFKCSDLNKVIGASKQIMDSKRKAFVNE